ncbi:MAG: efflux RND transporter periplasmic adaptor subunit [Thermochromatium sp.]
MRLPRPILLLAGVVLVSGSIFAEPTNPPPLATAPAEFRTLPREYRLDGTVEAVKRSTVSAQTQGQIQEILYDVDDFVEKGALLARIKDTEHRARVSQATADLKAASARLRQTQDEYDRILGLYRTKNVSESAMDKARADLDSAKAELEAATARLEAAQEQLAYTEIRAPYSGIVIQRHVELGEIAAPGTPIMSGIALDDLRVTVDMPQSLMPAVRGRPAGARRAWIYLPDGTRVESSRLTLFPFADPDSNTFRVRVELPPSTDAYKQMLFPGMYVKAGFVIGERSELVVPRSSVVQRSEVTGIYVVDKGDRIRFRQIRLGRALEDAYVVLAGLSEGEQVALDPIAAGARLKAQRSMHHAPDEGRCHD